MHQGPRLQRFLVSFALAGVCLACFVVFERSLFHGVHLTPRHVIVHLAVALTFTLLAGILLGAFSAAVAWSWHRIGSDRAHRHLVTAGGALAGVAIHVLLLAPSKYGSRLPPGVGPLVLAVLGGGSGRVVLAAARRMPRRWMGPGLVAVAMLSLAILYVDLHRYLRSYGNLHLVAGTTSLLALGWVIAHLTRLLAPGTIRRLGFGLMAALVASCTVVGWVDPDPHERHAVLVYGGIEKLVLRHLLWPLVDRDQDEASGAPWGPDCDDHDPDRSPFAEHPAVALFSCEPWSPTTPTEAPMRPDITPRRNLVFVLVDTVRMDTARPLLYDDDALFPREEFTKYTQYRSCGSLTKGVLRQLLGDAGLRPSTVPQGLSAALKEARYTRVGFGLAHSAPYVDEHHALADDEVPAAFRRWRQERRAQERRAPYFALLHFKGAHAPYEGSGSTASERYEDAVRRALQRVGHMHQDRGPDDVWVVVSDHGEELGDHDGRAHGTTLYEEMLHVPLLVGAPSVQPGLHDEPFGCPGLIDLLWRSLDGQRDAVDVVDDRIYASLDVPKGTHGFLSNAFTRAALFDHHKILWHPHLDLWELYDLSADPGEQHNLATAEPAILRRRAGQLLDHVVTARRPAVERPD